MNTKKAENIFGLAVAQKADACLSFPINRDGCAELVARCAKVTSNDIFFIVPRTDVGGIAIALNHKVSGKFNITENEQVSYAFTAQLKHILSMSADYICVVCDLPAEFRACQQRGSHRIGITERMHSMFKAWCGDKASENLCGSLSERLFRIKDISANGVMIEFLKPSKHLENLTADGDIMIQVNIGTVIKPNFIYIRGCAVRKTSNGDNGGGLGIGCKFTGWSRKVGSQTDRWMPVNARDGVPLLIPWINKNSIKQLI